MSEAIGLFAPADADTARIGQVLARHLKSGDLVLLKGPLGAGKSALARAVIRARTGNPELDVPSPTFLLVLPYAGEGGAVLHADLYRLSHPDEIEELGLFDDEQAIVLVEWPERAPALAERADWRVDLNLSRGGTGRNLTVEAPGEPGRLAPLGADLSDYLIKDS